MTTEERVYQLELELADVKATLARLLPKEPDINARRRRLAADVIALKNQGKYREAKELLRANFI